MTVTVDIHQFKDLLKAGYRLSIFNYEFFYDPADTYRYKNFRGRAWYNRIRHYKYKNLNSTSTGIHIDNLWHIFFNGSQPTKTPTFTIAYNPTIYRRHTA